MTINRKLRWLRCGWLGLSVSLAAGCAVLPREAIAPSLPHQPVAATESSVAGTIRLTSAELPDDAPGNPFGGAAALSEDAVVEQTLARNPSLPQMIAVADAAQARYSQARSFDDPMLGAAFAPASSSARDVEFGWRIEASQKFPVPGKRYWRGQNARADANAAQHEIEAMRLELIELARNAYYDLAYVKIAQDVNAESVRLLKEFRDNAQTRYKNAQATEQDLLQAELELARQGERFLELEQMSQVAKARLNTLLHRKPDAALPAAPPLAARLEPLADVKEYRQRARERRPDLQALGQRLLAEEASVMLALKELFPDVEVFGAYDAFWQRPEQDLRGQIGVKVNLPVVASRRQGMFQEAQAKVAQRRAELVKLADQVDFEVHEAYTNLEKHAKVVRLYDDVLLQKAQQNIKAAQNAYVTGKIPFLSLLEAQRNLIMLRERYYESVANLHRARAALDRAVGAGSTKE